MNKGTENSVKVQKGELTARLPLIDMSADILRQTSIVATFRLGL